MILAQIQDGICVAIYTSETLKENTIEIDSLNDGYLNRAYANGQWGERIEPLPNEENGLSPEQEQTVLATLANLQEQLQMVHAEQEQQRQATLDSAEMELDILIALDEMRLKQEVLENGNSSL